MTEESTLGVQTDEERPEDHIGEPVDPADLDPAELAHLAEFEPDLDGEPDTDPADPDGGA